MLHDFAVVIGRFQPFHVGHKRVIRTALQKARKVIILVGSSNLHISPKNPFTFAQRKILIELSLDDAEAGRVIILPLNDVAGNDTAWCTQVRELVYSVTPPLATVMLIGCKKDKSSYYLDLFKEWDKHEISEQYGTFNATSIREQFLKGAPIISEFLEPQARYWLKEFAVTPSFKWLLDEQQALLDGHTAYGKGPFITTDAVVTQGGRILLVTRKNAPYKGCLALPGGFLNLDETIADGCVRELDEETDIRDNFGKVPKGALKGFIKKVEVFDTPDRDARGRIVTHAHYMPLQENKDYYVQGMDDAEHAQWYPIAELKPEQFAWDHWFIIQKMTGVTWK